MLILKKYRKKLGYTQEQAAEKLNMSYRNYQFLEENDADTTMETFRKIIKTFKINDKDVLEYIKKDKIK